MASESIGGSCLCGEVRFLLRPPTQVCAHCHCTMCRRAHGAGFVTWVRLPKAQFEIVSGGETLLHYRSSEHAVRSFCGRCGSSLFFESSHSPDTVDIVLANLEGPLDRAPGLHVFFDDRADWIAVGDDLPRLGGETGFEPVS